MPIRRLSQQILKSDQTSTQLIRFLCLGGLATLTQLIFLAGLIEFNICSKIIANIVSYIIGAQVSYWGHKRFTFQYKGSKNNPELFSLFIIPIIMGFLVNQITFALMIIIVHYFFAFIVASTLTAITTFCLNKWVVFKEH